MIHKISVPPVPRPTCVAIDFDCTLAYFKRKAGTFFTIFTKRGVANSDVKACYRATQAKGGFEIDALIAEIAALRNKVTTQPVYCFSAGVIQNIQNAFTAWSKRALVTFPDSVSTLKTWRKQGVSVVIVTTGNITYQTQKVTACKIPHDKLMVVSSDNKKPGVMRQLLKRYGKPIMLIEDHPGVLDLVRTKGLTANRVITVRLLRKESRHCKDKATHEHRSFPTLRDITFSRDSSRS